MPRIMSLLALPALLVTGCVSAGGEQPAVATSASPLPVSSEQRPAAAIPDDYSEQVYRVLLGEIAGRRGFPEVALGQYLLLSEQIDDPRFAERAVQIGFYSRRYGDIVGAARRWVALDPESVDAQRSLAIVLVQVGSVDEALGLFLGWLEGETDDAASFAPVSGVLQRADDDETVLSILATMREALPDWSLIQQAYAVRALRAGQLKQARKAADVALQLRPEWNQALLLKGRILVREGQPQIALELLNDAFARQPEDSMLGLGYARLLMQEGRTEEARKVLQDLAVARPEDVDVLLAAGVLATQAGDLDAAREYLLSAVDNGQARPDAYYELGRVYERQGQDDEALEWYRKVRGGQRVLDAQVRIGDVLVRTGRIEQATTHFQVLRRENPQLAVRLYLAEAESFADAGQSEKARAIYDRALGENPEDHDLLYARALLAEGMGDLEQLEADLRLILVTDPDNAHALNALGYTLADRTERFEEARGYIERALELIPEDAAILDSMGWVLYRMGDYEQAVGFLRRSYELNPDEEIAAHLGEVLWVSGDREQALDVWNTELHRVETAPRVRQTMERFGI